MTSHYDRRNHDGWWQQRLITNLSEEVEQLFENLETKCDTHVSLIYLPMQWCGWSCLWNCWRFDNMRWILGRMSFRSHMGCTPGWCERACSKIELSMESGLLGRSTQPNWTTEFSGHGKGIRYYRVAVHLDAAMSQCATGSGRGERRAMDEEEIAIARKTLLMRRRLWCNGIRDGKLESIEHELKMILMEKWEFSLRYLLNMLNSSELEERQNLWKDPRGLTTLNNGQTVSPASNRESDSLKRTRSILKAGLLLSELVTGAKLKKKWKIAAIVKTGGKQYSADIHSKNESNKMGWW